MGTVPIFALRRADEDLARFIEPSVLLCKPCGGSVSQGGRRRGLWAPFRMGCGLQFSGKCESQAEASKCDTLTTQHFVETLQNFVKSRNENNVCLQRSESYRREAGGKKWGGPQCGGPLLGTIDTERRHKCIDANLHGAGEVLENHADVSGRAAGREATVGRSA